MCNVVCHERCYHIYEFYGNMFILIFCLRATMWQSCRNLGGEGQERGRSPLQILADQLTLSEPGGQIMPTIWLYAPPDFQTFRHPWTDRHLLKKLHLQMSQLTKHLSSTYQLVPTNVFINVEFRIYTSIKSYYIWNILLHNIVN